MCWSPVPDCGVCVVVPVLSVSTAATTVVTVSVSGGSAVSELGVRAVPVGVSSVAGGMVSPLEGFDLVSCISWMLLRV